MFPSKQKRLGRQKQNGMKDKTNNFSIEKKRWKTRKLKERLWSKLIENLIIRNFLIYWLVNGELNNDDGNDQLNINRLGIK